jgi:hypothetical protein
MSLESGRDWSSKQKKSQSYTLVDCHICLCSDLLQNCMQCLNIKVARALSLVHFINSMKLIRRHHC